MGIMLKKKFCLVNILTVLYFTSSFDPKKHLNLKDDVKIREKNESSTEKNQIRGKRKREQKALEISFSFKKKCHLLIKFNFKIFKIPLMMKK